MSDWTKALCEVLQDKFERIPKGFKSREQIGKELDLESAQAGRVIKKLLEAKKAERRVFRVKVGDSIRPIPHYRLTCK